MKLVDFINKFPNENSCKEHFVKQRIAKGVQYKKCNHMEHYWLKGK
jgi:hypothetical protein